MRILYITSFIPKKNATQAGINVTYDIINTLKKTLEAKIDVAAMINEYQYSEEEINQLQGIVEEKVFIEISKFHKFKNVILNLNKPPIASVRFDTRLKKEIKTLFEKYNYDYVICDYTQNAAYYDIVKEISPQVKTVWVEHDVSFLGVERKIELCNSYIKKILLKLQYKKLKQYETDYVSKFDKVITLNAKDLKLISKYGDVSVINPYINLMDLNKVEHDSINLMFWGAMNRVENEDAVMYFINEIWPYVKKENIKLYIVGANPTNQIQNLANSQIIVTGFVEDPKSIFNMIDISVVPLRLGAGIKIKVLESLGAGLPVVTTDVGAEGIMVENYKDLIIENDNKLFAEKINLLIDNPKMRSDISKNAKNVIEKKYYNGYNIQVLMKIFK